MNRERGREGGRERERERVLGVSDRAHGSTTLPARLLRGATRDVPLLVSLY